MNPIVAIAFLFYLVGLTNAFAEITPQRQEQLIYLLRQDCGSCHGMTLQGGLGPPLTTQALAEKSPEYLEMIIRDGLPEKAMPPWKNLLAQPEIRWLVERLQKGDFP